MLEQLLELLLRHSILSGSPPTHRIERGGPGLQRQKVRFLLGRTRGSRALLLDVVFQCEKKSLFQRDLARSGRRFPGFSTTCEKPWDAPPLDGHTPIETRVFPSETMDFQPNSPQHELAEAALRPDRLGTGVGIRWAGSGVLDEITLAVAWNDGAGAYGRPEMFHTDCQALVYSSEGEVRPGSGGSSARGLYVPNVPRQSSPSRAGAPSAR
jgi:hypothetical protein